MGKSSLRLALALGMAVPSLMAVHASWAADQLSIMSFGGAYQEAVRKAVFEPYTQTTGIKIVEEEYSGEIARIKAQVEAGDVTLNVVDVDAPTLQQGCDDGIYEKIDWSKIGDKSEWLPGTATECGVGTIVYSTMLAYDGDKLPDGPKTIGDLFDLTKFPGKRGLWKNPVTNLEFALLADGVPASQVYATLATPEGVDRAFKKLDTIKSKVVWWESGAQAPQLLASGEVIMTTAWNGRIFNANKEGKNFRIVWDGQLLDSDYWVIPQGAKDQAAALAFIKYAVEPQSLARMTRYIPYGPVRTTAMSYVSAEDADNLPTTPDHMKKALTIDQGFWSDHGDELRRRFNSWLAE